MGILYTDMARHSEIISWLNDNRFDAPESDTEEVHELLFDLDTAMKVEASLLHAADLVHPTLTWPIHKRFSILVATEFFEQFQEEDRMGLPALPFMGKDPSNLRNIAPVQVGFLQFVVTPLWISLNSATGEESLKFVLENVETNRKKWQQIADGVEDG